MISPEGINKNGRLIHRRMSYQFSKGFIDAVSSTNNIAFTFEIDEILSAKTVVAFSKYLNMEAIDVTLEIVYELLYLARMFNIDQLKESCLSFIKNCDDPRLMISSLIFASKFGQENETEEDEISKNIDKYIHVDTFRSIAPEILLRILSKSRISTRSIIELIQQFSNIEDVIPLFSLFRVEELTKLDIKLDSMFLYETRNDDKVIKLN